MTTTTKLSYQDHLQAELDSLDGALLDSLTTRLFEAWRQGSRPFKAACLAARAEHTDPVLLRWVDHRLNQKISATGAHTHRLPGTVNHLLDGLPAN